MSQAQELPAAPSAVTALSGAEASGAASHSSDGNGLHSFGGQVSPRAARSQISTAVSFEGARAAGSAALPSRSLEEESALSAAEGDVECSHSAEPNQAAPGSIRPRGGRLPRPSNSLISTAVQPASPRGHLQQPVSPKLNRANSVVSHTAPGCRPQAGRAGTPASVYGQGQGFLLPSRARQQSPAQPLAAEQAQQAAAPIGVGQHQPGLLQSPPAWQQMPPAFPGLQGLGGLAAGQQPDIQQSLQLHQHSAIHRLEHRGSFDGHHRSSDNGGGRQLGEQLDRALHEAAMQEAPGAAALDTVAVDDAAGPSVPAAASMGAAPGMAELQQQNILQQQPVTGLHQPSMQLFHNALAGLPTAVAGGLLQGVFGQDAKGTSSTSAAGYGSAAAAAVHGAPPAVPAGAAAGGQAGTGAAPQGSAAAGPGSSQQNMLKAGSAAVGIPPDLLQQLGVQLTPALLAVLQGQAGAGSHVDAHRIPGLPYTQQQLQQALGLLLAGLASQAEQYGLVFPGINSGAAAAAGQQVPGPVATTGMRPPPVPPAQAKSCDSSIQSAPAARQRGPTSAAAAGAAASTPTMAQAQAMSPMAAAGQAGQLGLPQVVTSAGPQQQQQAARQQLGGQPLHWRSPSPSPVPVAHAAARTSAAGEGHGSLNLGQGFAYLQSQQLGDAAAAAISSAGGVSRAGGGFTSEEGEAEAEAPVADAAGIAVVPDGAGQQASIGDAAHEDVDLPDYAAGTAGQQAATSPNHEQQQHAHGQPAVAGAGVDCAERQNSMDQPHEHQQHHMHQQQPQAQHPSVHQGDPVHPAASVHATMVSDGNAFASSSDADSEQSSTHSGGSNSNRGGAAIGHHGSAEVEIVSQPCGASHSASPPPSASRPAAATATGPVSRNTGVGSGAAAGFMDATEHQAEPAGHAYDDGGQHHLSQQQQQQPSASARRSNHHINSERQRGERHAAEQQHHHRDSSLAMATAGPTGTRSATISTNSGTVDMSIHNDSQRSGAGSQGEAPADGGWAADDVDDMQGAANSRDGEARGEPPGTFETAESGRAAENVYQPQLEHLQQQQQQQQQQHEHQQQQLPAASPVPGYSSAGPGTAATFSTALAGVMSAQGNIAMLNHAAAAAAAAGVNHAAGALPAQQLQPQPARFATASTPGNADGYAHIGSPSLQGGYSSSNVGIPGVSAAGPVAGIAGRESSAAGDGPAVGAPGSDHGISAADEVDAASALMLDAAAVGHALQGDNQYNAGLGLRHGEPAVGTNEQPQPAAAQHIEQAPLHAAFSVTSQLQPLGEQLAAAAAAAGAVAQNGQQLSRSPQQQQRRQSHHQHQQVGRGSCVGTNMVAAPPGSVMTTSSQAPACDHGYTMPVADAVPQVTEIHGYFADHAVPATAAAAQMAAAVAAAAAATAAGEHAHVHSDVQPQVTVMHGMLGASAGTAAEAQLAAAAAAAHGHAHTPEAAAAIGPAAAVGPLTGGGITGSTLGDGRLPPLPHAHVGRAYISIQHRIHPPAAGNSRVSPGAAAGHAANHGLGPNFGSPPPGAGYHGRAHYSPPAVNFDPHVQAVTAAAVGQGSAPGTGSVNAAGEDVVEGTGNITPVVDADMPDGQQKGESSFSPVQPSAAAAAAAGLSAAIVGEAASPLQFAAGAAAADQQHLGPQEQCPGSPVHAEVQGNSQLGQQDGSRGSPPVGMGRVGSVPPPDVGAAAAGGGEVGVVEQQPPRSQHTASEDAGSHQLAAGLHGQQEHHQQQQQMDQEADGPSHAANRQQQLRADSKSAATSPSQQHRRANGFTSAAAAAMVAGAQHHDRQQPQLQQLQQHWQQLQGRFHEGSGQVGGRAASMRFSCGQAEGSVAPGISSKIYGSLSAGFASGSKAEGSPSYGAGLDGCSCGNAMASGANGYHPYAQQNGHEQHENHEQQQAQSNSTRRRGRSSAGPADVAAAAAAAAAQQEGEGSHGSRSQEARGCKRQRTSCEAASVQQQQQQQQHITSSMQTTEA